MKNIFWIALIGAAGLTIWFLFFKTNEPKLPAPTPMRNSELGLKLQNLKIQPATNLINRLSGLTIDNNA